jgi:hypothetical protein
MAGLLMFLPEPVIINGFFGGYSASKAVTHFTRTIAEELKPMVLPNAMGVEGITRMWRDVLVQARVANTTCQHSGPVRRRMRPDVEENMPVFLFLFDDCGM